MKYLIFAVVSFAFLLTCQNPVDNNDDSFPGNTSDRPIIIFDNTHGISNVIVYSNPDRDAYSKVVEVPAGKLSAEFEWSAGHSIPFFFTYIITLKGVNTFTFNYIPSDGLDQSYTRIEAGKTTTISIPRLDETVTSPNKLLSNRSYVLIQNNSSFSIQLNQGSSVLQPVNISGTVVNPGEIAQYNINAGAFFNYQLRAGLEYFPLSDYLNNFEAGMLYSFVYDGDFTLDTVIEIKLENVAWVSHNSVFPNPPDTPIVTAYDSLLTVNWTAVAGAQSYEVYLGTGQIRPVNPVRIVSGTTVVLDGLVNKTTYFVWIKAVNNAGSSDFSLPANGIPWSIDDVPATPLRPVIIPGINQLTVNWETSGGASSYEVFFNTSPGRPPAPAFTTDKTSVIVTNLENNINYYFWIRAVNTAGKSEYSPLESGTPTIPTVVPIIPARPTLTARNREIAVSWQPVDNASSYEVWYGQSNNSKQAEKYADDTTNTNVVITGLTNETTYHVWIKAKNIVGTSNFSPWANATPSAYSEPPAIPTMLTVNTGFNALDLSWQPAEGALSYEIWTGVTNNLSSAVKHGTDISGTSTTLTSLENGTTYYIWVRAKNNIGTSGYSSMVTGTPSVFAIAPSSPQTAPVVIAGSGQLTISWLAVSGASAYEVWTATSNNSAMAVKQGNDVTGLSAVITGLTNGTNYYVWIKAKNSVGTSGFSPAANGTPQVFAIPPQTPAAPTTVIGINQLTVSWTAVQGAAAYEIWLATVNNSASAVKHGEDITASTSAILSDLTNGTTYFIWIKSKNSYGTSNFSLSTSGKPKANPEAPTLIASNNQITVNWTGITGADQYEVFVGTGANPPQTATRVVNAPATTTTITGLVNGTSYNVWIRGINSTGTGIMSNSVNAKPIGNIGNVSLNAANNRLTASWTAVAGADEYEVYYNTINTKPENPELTVSTNTAAINNLTNGTIYYVWVIAKNSNGSSTSTVVSGKPLGNPGIPTITPGFRQLTVSWTAVAGADEYEVYYGIGSPTTLATTTNQTSAIITGLIGGTTYHVRLRAKNAGGVSEYGQSVSSTPDDSLSPGLYRNGDKVGNQNLSMSLSFISTNAVSGDEFIIVLGGNETIAPATLSYSGRIVGITLQGYGEERIISLSTNGSMFTVNAGVTLTLDENITLMGRSANNASLVSVNSSGTLIMNEGAKVCKNFIAGNDIGGGISIYDGTFIMTGGIIYDNSAFRGAGVFINSSGIFTMNGGIISKNFTNNNSGSLGAGVYVQGTFYMNDGKISGNVIPNYSGNLASGAIYIRTGGLFIMHGGIINGNNPGGVYIDSSFNNSGVFRKQPAGNGQNSGIIYGSEVVGDDDHGVPLRNSIVAIRMAPWGPWQQRNTTVWETDHIDTRTGLGLSESGNPPFGQ